MKYGWYVSHDGTYGDVYLMDVATGEAEMVLEMLRGVGLPLHRRASTSPGGTASNWPTWPWTWPPGRSGTSPRPFPSPSTTRSTITPTTPAPTGPPGGWKNDEAFLIYDDFDIWRVDPTGSQAPRNVTEGVGRANDIRFRYVNLEPRGGGGGRRRRRRRRRQRTSIPARTLSSRRSTSTPSRTDSTGTASTGTGSPSVSSWTTIGFGNPTKAEDADVYVLTRSTFQEFPDLWLTDPDFRNMEKISNANPQQAEYVWGTAEILEWISNDGIPLQGILIKPEGFDPTKKYPMMVYFYERNSDGLHRYRAPAPAAPR